MKIIYLILFIGTVIRSSGLHYKFYDIPFNKEYILDPAIFIEGYIPALYNYYFRVPVNSNDKIKIEVNVLKDAAINFKLDACGFNGYPSDASILVGYGGLCEINLQGLKIKGKTYSTYVYSLETSSNVNYLAVHLQNYLALHYFSIYVHSENN